MYFAASVFAIGEPFLAKYISDPNFQRSGDSRKRGGRMSVAGPSQDANSAPFGGSAAAIAASVGVVV